MSEIKIVAASIVNFLRQQLEGESLNSDSKESIEVGVQCIETGFELSQEELSKGIDLLQLIRQQRGNDTVDRAEAEKLKNEGNDCMKADKFREAFDKYTKAIKIDPRNAVYYCNRAAAHFKLGEHEAAIADCMEALALQPNYGKAHGRLGLALAALDRNVEARASFDRAAQLDPDNESYKENLRLAEEKLLQASPRETLDLGGLLQNPALLNMATEMLSNPNMQNLISGLMNNTASTPGSGRMNVLLEASQALAQHMQAANPELVDQLRRQVRPPGPGDEQPPAQ
ncbi:PREDICTED: small glutamine-rich tetratricopeptide repeat-containing protein alpha-like [Papilio polytes]|uniref:small glutamine-rich tetratricopeptide repeat-containing protein alpha-like n=1 Tax=Papilio polytes TaxID=76194 RepID=UPI0006765FDC|nr:PREDICTED: small glutamine-rich tetratricopeptide repeat-containing protein alpha-like [Papilio polytes]